MTRAGKTGLAICVALFVTTAFVVSASAQQVVNPDATIVVANLNPVEGETVEIHNAPNDDSRCEGGIPVVFVGGLPPGILSQLVGEADANGDWSVNMYVPFQADWPSNYVGGPFDVEAFCFADNTAAGGPSASAVPEFAYVPVVVTLSVPVAPPVVTPPVPVAAPVPAAVPAADTVVIAPAFTG